MGLIQSSLRFAQGLIQATPPQAFLAMGIPLVPGFVIAIITLPSIATWYQELRKPSWTPPAPVFGNTWAFLYGLMGLASYHAWKGAGWGSPALVLYGAQLALNLAWQPIFFLAKRPGWAMAEISVLLAAVVVTTAEFFRVSPLAGQLMLPYLAFTAFATCLNWSIWKRNPTKSSSKDIKPE